MKSGHMKRRTFLKAAGAAMLTPLGFSARSYGQISGANSRLNVGFIGCGGMAGAHLGALLAMRDEENVTISTVCDIYETRAKQFQGRVADQGGQATVTTAYEAVLDDKDIDYVVIATPEHSHKYLTLDALDAGKHIYVEKPMTHTEQEALQVVERTKETGLKVQVGVQAMADDSYSSAYAAIKAGKIGPVVQAQIDYVRNYADNEGPWRTGVKSDMPKPADLDWETWLYPAKKRPWDPHRYFEWRNYRDYSGGVATDLFIHRITRIIRACGLTFPRRAVGMGDITIWPDGRELPDNFEMLLEYPAVEGITPGMSVYILGTMANARSNPHYIRGKKGTLQFTGKGWDILSEEGGEIVESHVKTGGEDVVPHHKNHHAAIRDGAELNCPVELGLYGVVAVCMGNNSWFDRRMMEWDYKRNRIKKA
ncbi:MAG: dehydrogenase [Candidatus Hydrogenedentota bacterium]